jgi:DNA repair protein RadC
LITPNSKPALTRPVVIPKTVKVGRPEKLTKTQEKTNQIPSEFKNILNEEKNKSVLELSSEVLNYFETIEELKDVTIEELIKIDGIGVAKAATILAAIELGKRLSSKKITKNKFITPIDVFLEFSPLVNGLKQEHLYAVYLDAKGRLIQRKLISIGNVNSALLDDKTIFKWAYKLSATAIILIHNHPSGDQRPSIQDVEATKKFYKITQELGFILLDHIIIGNDYYSMKLHHGFIK